MLTARESESGQDAVIIGEAQLILAEKRTSLAAMRTGIAVCALPLSVISLLIATSRYYDVLHVLRLLVPLGALCVVLLGLGVYLIANAAVKIHRQDCLLKHLKTKHSRIAEFME